MRTPSRLTIRDHRPWRNVIRVGVAVAAIGVVSGVFFYEDIRRITQALRAAVTEVQGLEGELVRIRARNAALEERLVLLEREAQVKEAAYRQVAQNLAEVERARIRLEEELAFYKGVMAETVKPGALSIHSVSLRPAAQAGTFRYELVLTRMGKSGKVVAGLIGLSVTGDGAEGSQTLGHESLLPAGAERPRFNFSHFQRLEGTLTLPEGFIPRSLEVEVDATGDEAGRVEQQFDWQGLLG